MTKYNQSVWLILLNVSLHYCRFNVSMNVARTPKSMKKGSQVLRNAAQLKDTERVVCVRVIINTWISWVCVCSSGGIFLDRQGHARCVGSITWSNLSTPRGPQPPQSSPPPRTHPSLHALSFLPSRYMEPHWRGDLLLWHRGGAPLSVMNYMTPLLFKKTPVP